MSKQVEDFFVIFDEVRTAFEQRQLHEVTGALDTIERIAVHLNMNATGSGPAAPGGVPDGQEGKVSGKLEATNKRTVSTSNGNRTAFDITVNSQSYSTFDKKIFPVGLKIGDQITVTFKQKGKFRNLVAIEPEESSTDIPF